MGQRVGPCVEVRGRVKHGVTGGDEGRRALVLKVVDARLGGEYDVWEVTTTVKVGCGRWRPVSPWALDPYEEELDRSPPCGSVALVLAGEYYK